MTRKTYFLRCGLGFQVSSFGISTISGLEILHKCGKSDENQSQKFWKLIPTFVEVTWEKTARRAFCPSIMNKVETWPYRKQRKIDFTRQLFEQVFCKKFRTILCMIITWEKIIVFVKVRTIFLVFHFPQMFNSNWIFHSLW